MGTTDAIVLRLVREGLAVMDAPRPLVQFTGLAAADQLLNDVEHHPHLWVLGCVMNRQVKAERAWLIPYDLGMMIGGFEFARFERLSLEAIEQFMVTPSARHRFIASMSRCLFEAIHRIADTYQANASNIWKAGSSAAEVRRRLLQFHGVGPKIANMAVKGLAMEFKVPFSDYSAIDIAPDIHVQRVLGRLGLADREASPDELILVARSLHPPFPALLDLPVWKLGREVCHAHDPACGRCALADLCPTGSRRS